MEAEDRISSLPDAILHHILSFLEIFLVVRTSILSKRWTSIWSSLHVLNFTSDHTLEPVKMELLVYKVLLSSDSSSSIRAIRITSPGFSQRYQSWIPHVLGRNIQEIDITYIVRTPQYDLPRCLLCCESLKVLKLDLGPGWCHAVFVRLPHTVCLPNLTQLKFRSFCFDSSEFIPKFLAGSPVLDTLSINQCLLHEEPTLIIHSPGLKHLELIRIRACSRDCGVLQKCAKMKTETRFVISAPQLMSFRCKGSILDKSEIDGQCSLVRVNMDLDCPLIRPFEDYKRKTAVINMRKFLRGLHCVKSLTLSASFFEVITQGGEFILMPLNELRHLNMNTLLPRECIQLILHLLQNSPELKTLVLDNTKVEGNLKYQEAEASPHCKFYDLKSVEILGGLNSLESLTMSGPFFEAISQGGKFIPLSLYELRHLHIRMFHSRDCIQGILYILQNSPKLETLVLDITKVEGILKYWKAEACPQSIYPNLKSIEIRNIKGSLTELGFLMVLLKNAVSLEKFTVFACEEHNKRQVEKFNKTLSTLKTSLPRETYCYFESCICRFRD